MAYQTKQQQAVLRCLQLRAEECLSAADLSEELRHGGLTVGLATVYRQLDKLTQQGLVHKVTTEEGALYQYCPQAGHPHDCFLLRCEGCGRMVHLDCRHLEEGSATAVRRQSMKDNELIVCRDVSLGYEGKSVLTDLDLTIAKGDYLCVVGDNGSGKSTLMRGLLGLIQPQSGTIEHAPALKHGAIGYLPQQTRAQRDFPATVLEVVLSGCLNRQGLHFFYTPAQRSEAMMNLGKLGILELKDACYRDLSGGQQQRVLLARALCAASQLLILDEPITGLDPAAAQDLYKTLAYLNQKEGMAIVMVTHDLKAALKSARTVLHIGRKGLFTGTASDYLASPQGRRFREELES